MFNDFFDDENFFFNVDNNNNKINFVYNFECEKILFRLELYKIEFPFVLIKIINLSNKKIYSEKFKISDLKINDNNNNFNNNNLMFDSFNFFESLFKNNLNCLKIFFSSEENLLLILKEKIKLNLKLKKNLINFQVNSHLYSNNKINHILLLNDKKHFVCDFNFTYIKIFNIFTFINVLTIKESNVNFLFQLKNENLIICTKNYLNIYKINLEKKEKILVQKISGNFIKIYENFKEKLLFAFQKFETKKYIFFFELNNDFQYEIPLNSKEKYLYFENLIDFIFLEKTNEILILCDDLIFYKIKEKKFQTFNLIKFINKNTKLILLKNNFLIFNFLHINNKDYFIYIFDVDKKNFVNKIKFDFVIKQIDFLYENKFLIVSNKLEIFIMNFDEENNLKITNEIDSIKLKEDIHETKEIEIFVLNVNKNLFLFSMKKYELKLWKKT